MAEVGSAAVAIFPSFKGFRSKVNDEVEASGAEGGKKFGGAFKGALGALAGLFAADKIITGFKSAINEASGLGESLNALNVVYGENSAGIQKLGQNAAKSLGLSNLEFNNLAVRFSSFSKTIAGEGGNVTGTLQDLTGRASDFASVMNLEVKDAAELFQSGLAGETEPLRAFGIDMSAAAVEAYALEKGIAKSASSMTEAQKVQARYGLLMQQTAQTAGDFSNTSDQLANQQRIASSRWKNISATIGGIFLPAMTGAFGFINTGVLPVIESLLGKLGTGGLSGAFAPLAGVISAVQPFFASFAATWAPMVPALLGLVAAFSPLRVILSAVQPVMGELVGLFQVLGLTLGTVMTSALTTVTPIMNMLVATLSGVLVQIMPTVVQLVASLSEGLLTLAPVIMGVVAQLAPLIASLVAGLAPIITDLVASVLPPLISIFGDVIGAIAPLISQIAGLLIPIIQALMPVVVTVFGVVSNVIKSVMQYIQGIIQIYTGLISGNWSQVWNGLVNIVSGTLRTVGNVLGGLFNIVTSALGGIGSWLVDSGRALIQGFIDGIAGMVGAIGNAVSSVLGSVADFFPHSPAKKGPFSGRGYTSYSGQALAKDFAGGIDSQQSLVARSASKLMSVASLNGTAAVAGATAGGSNGGWFAPSVTVMVGNEQLDARMYRVADSNLQSADSNSQYMRRGR